MDKTFKDTNNQIHVIDENFTHLLPTGCVEVTQEEANIIRAEKQAEYETTNPIVQPTKEQLLAELQALKSKIDALGETE